jgi:hypothetical protein
VRHREVGTLLAAITASSGGSTANRLRASLSTFFGWCIARGLSELNPVVGTHVAPEEPRERVLPMAELAAVWRACGSDVYGSCIKLLMLTGCRSAEIGGLHRDEIKDDMIVLLGNRVKNKRTHIVPLSAPAQAILTAWPPKEGEFVFCGTRVFASWGRGKHDLDQRLAAAGAKLDHWTQHDIRRSVATHMAEIGVAPHIVEAVLNHVSGHKAGVAGISTIARATRRKSARRSLPATELPLTIRFPPSASSVPVLVVPPDRLSVPLCTSTVPLLVNATWTFVVPLPVPLTVNAPALVKLLVPVLLVIELAKLSLKFAPTELTRSPPPG